MARGLSLGRVLKKSTLGLFPLENRKAWFSVFSEFHGFTDSMKFAAPAMARVQAVFKQPLCVLLGVFLLAFSPWPVHADLNGRQIVDKMVNGFQNENMVMQFRMTLIGKRGARRERLLRSRMKKVNGLSRSVISFEEPAELRGVKFLVMENKGRDDDQMLYLSSLQRIRRIASSQRSGSFMGTDFSYNDLSSFEPEKGKHTRGDDEVLDGVDCYLVESLPNNPGDYDYGRLKYWVRKDNLVAVKGEFFDKSLKLLKVFSASNLEEYKPGKWLARKIIMRNVQKGTSTEIEIIKYKADAKLPDSYFTERFLKDESQL